jgi:hypothetical protein
MNRFRFVKLLVLILLGVPRLCTASDAKDYAGQYVLRLGARNYIVLVLSQLNGQYTGSLSRPLHSSLGTLVGDISSQTITEPISSAVVTEDHLHFIANNPSDATNKDDFDLKLLSETQASLQMTSVPIDPWVLERVAAFPALSVATDWEPGKSYCIDDTGKSNPEMQRIYDEDQKPRQSADMSKIDWATLNKQDEARRIQVADLLAKDALHSGKDFEQAAFIFQHAATPGDYLLAHTLAMLAIAHGNAGALWIATATLDRYLNAIKQPQIYGTQYHKTIDTPFTQEPYDRTLISDALRRQLGVPSQAAQEKQLKSYTSASQH